MGRCNQIFSIRARRSKYQDQTMAVKTNKEFHALQHEMQMADQEIAKFDDRDLELMMEADEIAAALKAAEAGLKDAERSVTADRRALEIEARDAAGRIETLARQLSLVSPGPDDAVVIERVVPAPAPPSSVVASR
jgi:predicted  nucleic acid-binding Zn-ribbon protein